MSIKDDVVKMAKGAKEVSKALAGIESPIKNKALLAMAESLKKNVATILSANEKDLKSARRNGLSKAMIDRLSLSRKRILGMSESVEEVARLKDPVGEAIRMWKRPNGMLISKVRVPLGVVAIIYEARPNVTSDCIALCLKSSNAVILRGGKEAIQSNIAIAGVLTRAAEKEGIPKGAINLIETIERKAVDVLLSLDSWVDLVIPRGGEELIRKVVQTSRIPVIKHYKGICHTYVDEDADLNMAEAIAFNAKVQRPGVCNAMETLLVHKDVACRFLPHLVKRLKDAGVQVRGCAKTKKIVKNIASATKDDWSTEYLDLILSIKISESLDDALAHIDRYGTKHSEAIVTDDYQRALRFLNEVDAACVYVNASTRLTDGGQFGMGAEIGISTDKIHARGPMGLEELTSYKYIIFGGGQLRK